jgi:hypothetical protein
LKEYELKNIQNKNNDSTSFNKVVLATYKTENNALLTEKHRPDYYTPSLNRLLITEAVKRFNEWILENKKHWLIYQKYNSKELVIFQTKNRYSKERINKIEKRIKFLAQKYKKSNCVMLTLTFNPKIYNNRIIDISEVANKEFNRFMTLVRYHFKTKNREFPKYIKTAEYTKKGIIHFHICFFNCTRLLDWRELEQYWKNGFIFINRTLKKKKIRSPVDYICKYIIKGINLKNEKNRITQALNWLFGIRTYTNSRNLIYPLYYYKENPEYYASALAIINTNPDIKIMSSILEDYDKLMKDKNILNN